MQTRRVQPRKAAPGVSEIREMREAIARVFEPSSGPIQSGIGKALERFELYGYARHTDGSVTKIKASRWAGMKVRDDSRLWNAAAHAHLPDLRQVIEATLTAEDLRMIILERRMCAVEIQQVMGWTPHQYNRVRTAINKKLGGMAAHWR